MEWPALTSESAGSIKKVNFIFRWVQTRSFTLPTDALGSVCTGKCSTDARHEQQRLVWTSRKRREWLDGDSISTFPRYLRYTGRSDPSRKLHWVSSSSLRRFSNLVRSEYCHLRLRTGRSCWWSHLPSRPSYFTNHFASIVCGSTRRWELAWTRIVWISHESGPSNTTAIFHARVRFFSSIEFLPRTQLTIAKCSKVQAITPANDMSLRWVRLVRLLRWERSEGESISLFSQYKTIIEPTNRDLVHHFTTYQCDSGVRFDDAQLPKGVCDEMVEELKLCTTNVVAAWAIGGDYVRSSRSEDQFLVSFRWRSFLRKLAMPLVKSPSRDSFWFRCTMTIRNSPQVDFSSVSNASLSTARFSSARTDSSGIRFYVGNALRPHDLGYLQFGTESNAAGLAIPPRVDQFLVDSYCSPKATEVSLQITSILFCWGKTFV